MPKKSFKDDMNPALQFISAPEEASEGADDGGPPAGYKKNPKYIENKSRRVQLLMQPSLHQRIKARAELEGKSFNDLANILLEEALKK